MKNMSYLVLDITIDDTRDAIKGKDIFYKCAICKSIIPSIPRENSSCLCGNIGIDKDLNRLFVRDYNKFLILRRVTP
jgi:hypothetical protein